MLDWRQQSRQFAGMTFYRRTSVSAVTFAGNEAPQRAQEGLVGPEFFDLLGTPPLRGRVFSAREFERREPVVVLSEGLWQEQFARSPDGSGADAPIDGSGPHGHRRHAANISAADERHAILAAAVLLSVWRRHAIESETAMASR